MQNVKSVQDDLSSIRGHSSESKASLLLIKEKIVKTQMVVLAAERKRRNLKKLLLYEKVLQKYVQAEQDLR